MNEIRAGTNLTLQAPMARSLSRVEALEQGLVPVEQLPPEQAARYLSYFRGVSNDLTTLRNLPLPSTDALAVDGTLQQVFGTSAAEVGPQATAAAAAYVQNSQQAAPAGETRREGAEELAERLKRLFPKIDKNKDGVLSNDELNEAQRDPSIRGKDAAALETLIRHKADIMWLSHDETDRGRNYDQKGVTLKDLERLGKGDTSEHDRVTGGRNAHFITQAVDDYSGFQKRIGRQSTELFEGMPDPNSVKQGQIGDCFFLAALVALCTKDPKAVKNMIKQNPDGSYTVTFPGRPPVTVSALTDSEKALAARSNGLWAAVLEKAYAKMTQGPTSMEPGFMGSVDTGLEPFSRQPAEAYFLSSTKPADLKKKLVDALKAGRLVEAGCMNPKLKGLVAGHAYTVLAFDEKSDQLTLRNPWGDTEPGNDGKDDGIFKLTFAEFMTNFFSLGIA